jgi:hypothetical protein
MNEIVCLGWGSLIWCQKALPVAASWQPDGPSLPIEFARESKDRRITLVVCEGAPDVTTLWARLNVETLEAARAVLQTREGCQPGAIGWCSPDGASQHAGATVIGQWASERNLSGVVWTALQPKIGAAYRTPTLDEVVGHLARLEGRERDTAEEYVRFTPRQIVTPYRTAIEGLLGWTSSGLI